MAIDLDVHGNTKPLEAAVQAAINRIRRQPIKITVDDKGATQPLGNMKRAADEFSKSMEAANARILAFGASMAIINGVADAFKGMVRNLVEVEKSLADINVVMGLSTQNLDKFGDGLFKVAKETGAAFKVAADAATEYARQGLAVEETLKRTRDALVLTRLTGMDSAEAVKSLTAAMNTYGNQIKDTTQLVSKFAAVDVQFAVSAEDFAAAISRTGQAAKSAGVNIDELIGIVTSAQQQTARGGAVIGNALKTIFTKTGRTDTLNQLENLGIAVRDLEGNTIGAKRILTDLANTFDTLSEAQKAQITQTMGGLFHINILKAVLSDAAKQNGILANATQISANATDEAIQKNEQLRQTMSAMATETGLAVKQLSVQIGELMLAPGMEKILNAVKSIAEGAGDLLGDGESAGSKFANGFLKGLGNIITGPGLVVLSAVFIKLFGTAVKFTKESLTSLIGVTSEAQKQKAIQTTLVTLLGQNAALGKEMLRTDISRTEKEKILLGLLRMQTAEAENLNRVSKQLASTLYTRGYGPGLTQGRRRAYGHIPNFADPERSQAARGGYAAGSIRTMNMPGEGSVIYNSAETVKNFAGFKQPAIMPPQSSKAGKNYQQAFGSIHGFDPYAAGGYIPNFNKQKGVMSRGSLNAGGENFVLLTGDQSGRDGNKIWYVGTKNGQVKAYDSINKAQKSTDRFSAIDVPYFGLGTGDKAKIKSANIKEIDEKIRAAAVHQAVEMGKDLIGDKYQKESRLAKQVEETFNNGSFSAAAGSTFESAIGAMMEADMFQDYSARTGTSLIDLPYSPEVFGLFGAQGKGKMGGEVKGSLNSELQKSAAEKFYKVLGLKQAAFQYKKSQIGIPSQSARDKFEKAGLIYDEKLQIPGQKRGTFAPGFRVRAGGFIPNFADPLSDAIGREKAAGVPVSQIRVGSHGALMSKGNPLGLGVTNTYDEPNGLRDVFGANGFVPNYAVQPSDFLGVNASKRSKDFNKLLDRTIKRYKDGLINQEELNRRTKRLSSMFGLQSYAAEKVNTAINDQLTKTTKFNAAINRATNSVTSAYGRITGGFAAANKRFEKTAMGRAFGSTGGQMGLMMGLPMAGGFLQDSIGGKFGAAAGGMLTGAGTGASIGMMFGGLGIAIGGAVGAFGGLISAIKDATEAEKEKAKEVAQRIATSLPQDFYQKVQRNISEQDLRHLKEKMPKFRTVHDQPITGSAVAGGGLLDDSVKNIASERFRISKGQGAIISKYLKNYEATQLYDVIEGVDKEGKIKFSGEKKAMAGKDYEKMLRSAGVFDGETEEQQEVLKKIVAQLLGSVEAEVVAQEQKTNAIILQLNIQKAIIDSQKAAAQAQFKIKSKYIEQGNMIDTQLKFMSGFISEEQKARLKYVQSMNKAAEAYELGQAGIEQGKREKLLGLVAQSPDLQQKLKTQLYKEQLSGDEKSAFEAKTEKEQAEEAEKSITNIVDLNNRLLALKLDLLEAQIRSSGLDEKEKGQLDSIVSQTQLQLINLENEKKLKEDSLKQDKLINVELGKRSDKMRELIAEAKAFKDAAQFDIDINQYYERIRRAQYQMPGGGGRGLYRTEQQNINFERAQLEARIGLDKQSRVADFRYNVASRFKELGLDPKGLNMEGLTTGNLVERTKDQARSQLEKLQTSPLAEGESWIDRMKQRAEYEGIINNEKSEIIEKIKETLKAEQRVNDKLDAKTQALREELELREKILKYKRGEALPGDDRSAMSRGIGEGMDAIREKVQYMDYELGEKIPGAFADGLANAMTEALNGTKNIKEALTDAAISFLGMIQKAMMQKAAYSIVGGMFSQGGNVRNYSRGGGVPAMVSNGEYVMGRDAVAKYGGSFMHGLNAGGKIPGYSNGGAPGSALAANFGGGRGYASGRAYQSRAMSSFFYRQSGNVGLAEDTSTLQGILAEEERKRQEAEARRQAKKAKRRQLLGMVASIGLMYGLGKMNLFGPKAPGTGGVPVGQEGNVRIGPHYYGGPIRKYASGGYISGKSGIDQIPAMLSEGEYVIRASSARQLGKPMLDRINAGKFNEGGAVSELMGSSETASSGGNTNNINISINMERGSGSKKENQSQDNSGQNPADRSSDEQNNAALAERIKQQVVAVIVEEQRPGGLLSE